MDVQKAKRVLQEAGFTIRQENRLPNNTGYQLRLTSGQVVNVYDKGTFNVQGKDPDRIKNILEKAYTDAIEIQQHGNHVFVVYGHDQNARTELDALLRRWGLEPLFLDELPSEGQTIIEKLEKYTSQVFFAVVLATPDDEGYRAGHQDEKKYRTRQNVVLELGMLLAVLGRKRVAILIKDPESMERPSDIQGLIYIPFKDSVNDARIQLAKELNAQGYHIDVSRL
ncbi:Predicted nucleotide-binding protein containing TIR-like domain [Desulfacinum infernum DSM 9756]|uniref:Predicted nucleotide-binding protein containing TIR-like domain n=1 Tax=Desulfacinum infernum DSM 9756 TaxID=1121391 RepID=A0A1M4YAJ1_9BACT|nr:TIR domain-containing protein [Desulfacinum infernum]SHF02784.1 Predicted nucleotide-binding protein containing TIR-like domain [Desulfacinum infernum DSM 9756]